MIKKELLCNNFSMSFFSLSAEKWQEKITYLDLLWGDLEIGIKFLAEIGGNGIFFLSLLKYKLKFIFGFQ